VPKIVSEVDFEPVNDVTVVGRLGADASEYELPSGDVVVNCRIIVPRADGRVDTLDCAVAAAALRKKVLSWQPGDVVELQGALHRRFWRGPSGPVSRYEIGVAAAKRLKRAA
jgi:single-strand DNA-binding protein